MSAGCQFRIKPNEENGLLEDYCGLWSKPCGELKFICDDNCRIYEMQQQIEKLKRDKSHKDDAIKLLQKSCKEGESLRNIVLSNRIKEMQEKLDMMPNYRTATEIELQYELNRFKSIANNPCAQLKIANMYRERCDKYEKVIQESLGDLCRIYRNCNEGNFENLWRDATKVFIDDLFNKLRNSIDPPSQYDKEIKGEWIEESAPIPKKAFEDLERQVKNED